MILIMCPTAHAGKARRSWPYWRQRLEHAGIAFETRETRYPGHAFELARQARETVVAVGGDGTINEVLNGVLAGGHGVHMGVLYCGTSPDFCRFHKIPILPQQAGDALIAGCLKRVDVVKMAYHNEAQEAVEGYFACSCNIGLGAAVARFANARRRIYGDVLGTLLGVLRAVAGHQPQDLRLCLDGKDHLLRCCNHLLIVKNPHIASGLKLNLDLRGDDGRGYILAICNRSRLALCRLLPSFYTGRIASAKDVFLEPFTTVRVEAAQPLEIEFDGDPRGYLPVRAEIMPRHLPLIGAADA